MSGSAGPSRSYRVYTLARRHLGGDKNSLHQPATGCQGILGLPIRVYDVVVVFFTRVSVEPEVVTGSTCLCLNLERILFARFLRFSMDQPVSQSRRPANAQVD